MTHTPVPAAIADDRPLFILGCPRSGTTLTRDLLRRVPGFLCPEETHFFRWAQPFRTDAARRTLTETEHLQRHRALDGIDEAAFAALLETSRTRAELQRRYVAAYAAARGVKGAYRWFDKTPQNVYGAALIAQEFPRARLLHLVRNPLNVAASLKRGGTITVPDMHGAASYWCEAVQIMQTIAAAYPDRVLTVTYETLIADVPGTLAQILDFAEVDAPPGLFAASDAKRARREKWRRVLTAPEAATVAHRCRLPAQSLGYDLSQALTPEARAGLWGVGRRG